MKISRIEIQNFLSIKDLTLDLSSFDGLIHIEGENRDYGGSNGSGKSSVFEAIVWSIFGETIRNSTQAAIINNVFNRGCSVKITIEPNITIIRTLKPNKLEFYIGEQEFTQQGSKITQDLINKHLNIDFKTFISSSYFGQHSENDFISLTIEGKRMIINHILSLGKFFDIRDKARHFKSNYSALLNSKKTIINEYVDLLPQLKGKQRTLIYNRVKKLEKELSKHQVDFEVMKFWDHAFSEEGILKFIVRKVLPYLNEKCNEFISELFSEDWKIEFQDNLSEVITVKDKLVTYNSLSNGEKKRINICVLLSLQSLIKFLGKNTPNVLFFDEIADSLDRKSIDKIYILLQSLKKEHKVFLVTHNVELKEYLKDCQRIKLVRENGVTVGV